MSYIHLRKPKLTCEEGTESFCRQGRFARKEPIIPGEVLVDLETRAVGFFEDCLPHWHIKSLGSMTQQVILWPELMFFSWVTRDLCPQRVRQRGMR